MPDLRGLSARDATRALTSLGMTARLTGSGFVIEHSPAAGTVLVSGTACVLKLGRQPPVSPGASQ
jgi:beta-lactam-binding protein with PASTA domain